VRDTDVFRPLPGRPDQQALRQQWCIGKTSRTPAPPEQLAAGPIYPNFLPATSLNPPAGTVDVTVADSNLRNPYTHQANIAIERQLTTDIDEHFYLWSHGVRLYGVRDLNVRSVPRSRTRFWIEREM
jgi:hypothetical protein